MKRKLAIFLAFLILFSTFSFVYGEEDVIKKAADFLQKEKVLIGNGTGDLLLDKTLTRQDAVIIIARLMGAEEEAKNFPTDKFTFLDVTNSHYKPYLAWAFAKGYFVGHSPERFGFGEEITLQQYASVLLRTLGHNVEYKLAVDKAKEIGILKGIDEKEDDYILAIPRSIVAIMLVNTLSTPMNSQLNTERPMALGEKLNINVPEELIKIIEESQLLVRPVKPPTSPVIPPIEPTIPPAKPVKPSTPPVAPPIDPPTPPVTPPVNPSRPETPKAPTVLGDITSNSIKLNPIVGAEYAIYRKGGIINNHLLWQTSNIFVDLEPNTEYTFVARIRSTSTNLSSYTSNESTSIRTLSLTPNAPTVSGAPTWDTIALNKINGVEYSIYSIGGKVLNSISWQDSNIFTDLIPDTEYTFIVRIKETKEIAKSANSNSSSIIKTAKLPEINARFISKLNLNEIVPFGNVELQVLNLPNAYQYEIDYKLEGDIKATTPRTLLSSNELPLIRYTKLVTVRVYDSKSNVLRTFKDVELTLEDASNATITAEFITKVSADGLVPFGVVKINLANLAGADAYELDYKLSNGKVHTTERTKLSSTDPPIFRYTEYVTIRIYDSTGNLLRTFKNVSLSIYKETPTIKATFKAKVSVGELVPFGTVSIEVKNLPQACQYEIDYKLAAGEIEKTPMSLISSENPPLIRYTEYIKVRIYDKDKLLIYTFEDVPLIK